MVDWVVGGIGKWRSFIENGILFEMEFLGALDKVVLVMILMIFKEIVQLIVFGVVVCSFGIS